MRFDDFALWALPGAKNREYANRIKVLTDANNILTQFHQYRGATWNMGNRRASKSPLRGCRARALAHFDE